MRFTPALLLSLAPTVAAQGGDDCSSAVQLVGETFYGMNSLQYTDSGFMSGGACSAASSAFERDQFFQWSAAVPGDYAFLATSAFQGGFDCQIALHSGIGCGATCLQVADNPNSLDAILHLRDVGPADDFLLQFGGWYTSSFSTSPVFRIIHVLGDTCDKAIPIAGTATHEFRAYALSASGFTGTQSCGLTAPAVQDKFFRWTAEEDGDYWFDTFESPIDAWVTVYGGPDCNAACLGVGPPSAQGQTGSLRVAGIQAGDELLVQVTTDWDIQFVGEQSLTIYRDLCAVPDAFEPNDSTQTAFPIVDGLYEDLAVSRGVDDADYFVFRLEPGESVFADHTSIEGAPSSLRAHDVSGAWFSTHLTGIPGAPFFTNTKPWASDFYVSIVTQNGSQLGCAGYDLDFRIAPDPCSLIPDDQMGENDTCDAPLSIGPGLYPDQFISMTDPDYYRVVVAPGETFRANLSSSDYLGGLYVRLLDVCSAPHLAYGDRTGVQWTNPGPSPQDAILEIRYTPPGDFVNRCVSYDLGISGGLAVGTSYCAPTVANSTGGFPALSAFGSPIATDNQLTLHSNQLPDASFGYYAGSQTQGFAVQPGGSQGTLCLGGAVARFIEQVGQSVDGQFIRTLDLTNVPEPSLFETTVLAGQTWNFQLWYRDTVGGMSTSNFSEALSITYQ